MPAMLDRQLATFWINEHDCCAVTQIQSVGAKRTAVRCLSGLAGASLESAALWDKLIDAALNNAGNSQYVPR